MVHREKKLDEKSPQEAGTPDEKTKQKKHQGKKPWNWEALNRLSKPMLAFRLERAVDLESFGCLYAWAKEILNS